jgi:hypothetical protein
MEPLERVLADVCLGEGAGEALEVDLRGFLLERGVEADDVEAILSAPRGLAVYRSLVRNGLAGVVVRMLPRTRARMNAARPAAFDADVARFLDAVGPRTHYLRDVPHELFAWTEARWRADPSLPPYLADLAAHELASFAVAASETRPDAPPPGEIALDRPVAFADSTRLHRYAWAVHELPADDAATDPPAKRDVDLLAHRDAEHAVRWLELSPLARSIVARLLERAPLGAAIAAACTDHGTTPPTVAADVARLLAELGDRGILLGSA